MTYICFDTMLSYEKQWGQTPYIELGEKWYLKVINNKCRTKLLYTKD